MTARLGKLLSDRSKWSELTSVAGAHKAGIPFIAELWLTKANPAPESTRKSFCIHHHGRINESEGEEWQSESDQLYIFACQIMRSERSIVWSQAINLVWTWQRIRRVKSTRFQPV